MVTPIAPEYFYDYSLETLLSSLNQSLGISVERVEADVQALLDTPQETLDTWSREAEADREAYLRDMEARLASSQAELERQAAEIERQAQEAAYDSQSILDRAWGILTQGIVGPIGVSQDSLDLDVAALFDPFAIALGAFADVLQIPLSAAGELFLTALEKGGLPAILPIIDQIIESPGCPQEIKDLLGEAHSPLPLLLLIPIALLVMTTILPAAMALGGPFASLVGYEASRRANQARLDPNTVMRWSLRHPETLKKFDEHLRDQGWHDTSIDLFRELSWLLPTPQDLVTWQAREVFEPDAIAKYGLDDEFDKLDLTLFGKVGIDKDMARNHWRAHWEHASWVQVVEMLRRGLLTKGREVPPMPTTKEEWEARDAEGEKELYEWFRLVEIPPFWRDKLTQMTWEVPTRVDVRRWWDMRTIDEERLRSIYHAQGYHGKDLDDYVLWTKVYVAFPDLLARWKNGWITEEDIRAELTGLGMPEDRVVEMIQTKIKPAKPERTATERDLTKSEIVAGVKKDVITWAEGSELLQSLGYDQAEAEFILQVRIGAMTGSPESYIEFKEWVERRRQASGLPSKVPPADLVEWGGKVRGLEQRLKQLHEAHRTGSEVQKVTAELTAAKTTYDRLYRRYQPPK